MSQSHSGLPRGPGRGALIQTHQLNMCTFFRKKILLYVCREGMIANFRQLLSGRQDDDHGSYAEDFFPIFTIYLLIKFNRNSIHDKHQYK